MKLTKNLILIILLAGLISCKIHKTDSGIKNSEISGLSEKKQLDFKYLFFDGIKLKTMGNYGEAVNKFNQASRINPKNSAVHYELSRMYAESGNMDLARLRGELAVEFDKDNVWYKKSLIDIYRNLDKNEKAIKLLEELVAANPGNTDYLIELSGALKASGNYKDAIKILEKVEELSGIDKDLSLEKKDLFLLNNQSEKAINEIQKLIDKYPDEYEFRGILAQIYLDTQQPAKALDQYQQILEQDSLNPDVHFSLSEYYRNQGDKSKSFEELKLAFSNPNASLDIKLDVLNSYLDLIETYPELKPQALELGNLATRVHPKEARSHAILAEILILDGSKEDALIEYNKALQIDKSQYSFWVQVLILNNDLNNFSSVIELSEEAIDLFPNQPFLFLLKGYSAMQLKKYDLAEESLKNGLNITIDDPKLSSQFQSTLGDCYHKMGKNNESDFYYEQVLKLEPNNEHVLNNYAYYLSIRKENLERALEMSEKCNQISPGNPSFLDTYAWVLFQLNQFEKANNIIDKALENGGNSNATILEHKGDIMWKLGSVNDAIDFWNKAKKLGASGVNLERKISEGKYID